MCVSGGGVGGEVSVCGKKKKKKKEKKGKMDELK